MPLPSLGSDTPTITYEIGEDETVLEAITDAFRAIDINVYELETTIQDWVKDCTITEINWKSDDVCRVSTMIWDHPVVITTAEIRIFEDS